MGLGELHGAVEGLQASWSIPGWGASCSIAGRQRPCYRDQARPRDPSHNFVYTGPLVFNKALK